MYDFNLTRELVIPGTSKMVMLIMDGLGGLPQTFDGGTELETARTPHLDALAGRATCGLMEPISAGIATETCVALCDRLRTIRLAGVEVLVEPVKEHRFVLVLRGEGLAEEVSETDPQKLGLPPLPARALVPQAERTAALLNEFVAQAHEVLKDQHPANALLLRGFAKYPAIPTMNELYGIRAAAIATYPMYKGLARLVGMNILETGDAIEDEFTCLEQHWADYDFFFIHVKHTDSRGEDGNFDAKVSVIERVDKQIPRLMKLNPDVVMVTGDHSTPAVLASHSWHPLPFLIASRYCRPDRLEAFSEFQCGRYGSLGTFPAVNVMPLMMANALRLTKFGA
jgi:2,3-bisphosphoglycerate-independent phosphoglycerate mutase